jgi:hypothetical protein
VIIELSSLAYVFSFIACFLFIYKYWRLSLKLEVAARISALDVQGSKIWQSLLFIFPILVGAAATAWLVFDEMRSRMFNNSTSTTYIRKLGTFLTAFPAYFLLAIQIDVIRRLKRVEKKIGFLSVKTSNVALLSSLLILYTLSFLGLQIFGGQDFWTWTVIIIVV